MYANDSSFCRYKVYANIHGGSPVKERQTKVAKWGCRQRQFSAFSLAIFSEIMPALLYGDMQSVIGF